MFDGNDDDEINIKWFKEKKQFPPMPVIFISFCPFLCNPGPYPDLNINFTCYIYCVNWIIGPHSCGPPWAKLDEGLRETF